MFTRSTVQRFPKRLHAGTLLIALAIAAWSVVAWQNYRSAPTRHHIEEGIRLLQARRGAAAELEWRKAVQLDPDNAHVWELLGDYYLTTRQYAPALEAFRRVERLSPETLDLQTRLAVCAHYVQDFQAAQRYAEAELKHDPDDATALEIGAAAAKRNKRLDEQLQYLQRWLELRPRDGRALLALTTELAERQEWDKVLPLAEQLVQLAPHSKAAYLQRGMALFNGDADPQNLVRAEADFKKVLQIEPGEVEAHRYLGRIALRTNRAPQAIAHFEAVGRGRPHASLHLMELSIAYRRAGNVRRAEILRQRFTYLKDLNTRMMDLRERITREPKDFESYLQMAQVLFNSVEVDEAGYHLYRFRFQERRLQAAGFYLDKALEMRPGDTRVKTVARRLESAYKRHLQIGLLALQQNNYAGANRHLESALLLRADDARTAAALQQIALHQSSAGAAIGTSGLTTLLKDFQTPPAR